MSRKQRREPLQSAKQPLPAIRQPLVDATAAMTQFAVSMQLNHQSASSGPLPPPEVLAKYDAISPGIAGRIVKMAEDEALHRRQIEKTAQATQAKDIKSYRRSEILGQVFAFAIGSVAICGSVFAGVHGAQITGTFIGTAGVTGLVTVFILGRRQLIEQKEMDFRHQLEAAKAHEERQRFTKESANKTTVSTSSADQKQLTPTA